MQHLPREPEAFTEHVAQHMHRMIGRGAIEITGPLELTLDGEPIDLADLFRTVQQEPPDDEQRLLEQFVTHLLNGRQLQQLELPFATVSSKIFPRIYPLRFFRDRRSDLYACQPFVNDTVVLYVVDLQGAVAPVTTEQVIRWGIDLDELDDLARRNLSAQRPRLRLALYENDLGIAAMINTGDGYDASRLLLEQLHLRLAPELGVDFFVAIPTRDVFIAFPTEPNDFVDQLRRRVTIDYRKLPYPITDDLFLVTRDGVAGSAAA